MSIIKVQRPGGKAGARPKSYTDEDLALFAAYRGHREALRPAQCNYCPLCWVVLGPPAINSNPGHCLGCGGSPRSK